MPNVNEKEDQDHDNHYGPIQGDRIHGRQIYGLAIGAAAVGPAPVGPATMVGP